MRWLAVFLALTPVAGETWSSAFPPVERIWVGADWWAGRLQDWRLAGGRLEAVVGGPNRHVSLLTAVIGEQRAPLDVSVRLGRLGEGPAPAGWAGLRLGCKGPLRPYPELRDPRDDALRGAGVDAGITASGTLFIGRQQAPIGLPREGWKVASVSSEHGPEVAATRAFDGDPSTIWHTRWGEGGATYPHELVLDLGARQTLRGIGYLARQEQQVGRIKEFELYLSDDPARWGEPALRAEFQDATGLQQIAFPAAAGRYARLVALSGVTPRPACVIAELFLLDREPGAESTPSPAIELRELSLRFAAEPRGDRWAATLTATAPDGRELARLARDLPGDALEGGVALVGHHNQVGPGAWWFTDLQLSGEPVQRHPERAFGPILWSQYTLSRRTLTMSAQMPPLGAAESDEVRLEVRRGATWRELARAPIDADARVAAFRLTDWEAGEDVPYRLVYEATQTDGSRSPAYWTGTIRHDPVERDELVVAAFTGNSDPAFPNVDLVAHVRAHNPDLLFFSGDNIYENVAGFGVERQPSERAALDYLRKWYVYGWAFGELMRDRPTISIPDDHDVYQGNLWGQGGRPTDRDNKGGYLMPARWVNLVQRTQTACLPQPFDPAPIDQGIGVYFTEVCYGRVSFAVLEDRKFKTGPSGVVPPTASGRADHADETSDPRAADVPGAELLGPRQLRFLEAWAADWRGAEFKATLSQTVFAGLATHHGPELRYIRADYDSNGWPQSGRNAALAAIRRGHGFMIGGDQHLATLVQHGIDTWNDAGWSFCVPSVTNFYLRAWRPSVEPRARAAGLPDYCGEYRDGLGNAITLWAATNPDPEFGPEPAWLHSRKPGYGIVRFHKPARTITVECWPRYADPRDPATGGQYAGWPKTIAQLDNDGRAPVALLPTVRVEGLADPVVQVINAAGRVVSTLRLRGTAFRPPVYAPGAYTVRVGEPDRGLWRVRAGVVPGDGELVFAFPFERRLRRRPHLAQGP